MKVGDVIDEKYELTQLMSESGLGATFEGVEKSRDHKVVIKCLDPGGEDEVDVVQRLVFETQTVGGMGSEFIVAVLGAGTTAEGGAYVVMERVQGTDLAAVMKRERRPFAPHRAVGLARQICRGVGAAHKRGVLHLGLRPDKMIISRRGGAMERVKILDFGFARLRELRAEAEGADPSVLKGPPYYTAPEVIQETHEVDHRADIYSTGVILYELLTGQVPFQAESFDDLVVLVATTNPRKPRELRPNLSEELAKVVLKAIAREADNRFPNMEALGEALAPFALTAAAEAVPGRGAARPAAQKPAPPESAKPSPPAQEPRGPSPVPQRPSPDPRQPAPVAQDGPPDRPPPKKAPRDAERPKPVPPSAPPPRAGEEPRRPSPPVPPPAVPASASPPAVPPPPPAPPPRASEEPRRPSPPAPPSAPPPRASETPQRPAPAPPPVVPPSRPTPERADGPAESPPPEQPPSEDDADRVGTTLGYAPPVDPETLSAAERRAKGMPLEPPLVPPRADRHPGGAEGEGEPKPKKPQKLRASELAVLEAGRAKATRREEPPPPAVDELDEPKRSSALLILVVVLVVAVLIGAVVVVALALRGGGGGEGDQVATPPEKAGPTKAPERPEPPTKDVAKRDASPTPSEPPEKAVAPALENDWISVTGAGAAKLVLGVSSDSLPARIRGFRPALGILAPSHDFEILQHEVTWSELGPWLMNHPEHRVEPPSWLPQDGAAPFPATGMSWRTARSYCESLGAALPSEVEWELAARGVDRRPNPWGSKAIDLEKTHVYRPGAPLSKVMTSVQDVTPGSPDQAIFDMLGNALEWTSDVYRPDGPRSEETLEHAEGIVYHTIRGLPPAEEAPSHVQSDGAAYRAALCTDGPCPESTADVLQYVGVRCVRRPAGAPGTTEWPVEEQEQESPPQKAPVRPHIRRPPTPHKSTGPIAPNPYR